MIIRRAVKTNLITQGFGPEKTKANLLPIYQKYGLLAHNGLDFLCSHGEPVYFDCDTKGFVEKNEIDGNGGVGVCVITQDKDGQYYRHIYWHFLQGGSRVQAGQEVETGDLLGLGDTTGTSTGDHLHRGLKRVVKNKYGNYQTINHNNGYLGAIDPEPFYRNVFVVDYMNHLKAKISILKKIIEVVKKLLALKK